LHLVIGFEGGVGKAPSCSAGERNALIVFGNFNDEFLLFEFAENGPDEFFVAGELSCYCVGVCRLRGA